MTKVKRLRSTAIIPSDLYVERAADRQLEQVVADMGRPPYVLVARQMGKTNLLINLKRRREAFGDVVVYLDLTNRFRDSRGLFRHFVDAVMEAVVDLSQSAKEEVDRIRKGGELHANIEFDRSLRAVLSAVPDRKFAIILDEIDSLINVPYSDVIFAQIRTMYFSRISYPVYERLTYVLSGVAEPSDLIKDKNISPFNIGEKIYLDDFSKSEFGFLLKKASLNFPVEVSEEIYNWSSGNPRMTWDICSELEDISNEGRSLKATDVSAAVEKLYLKRFDLPPVDHIRTLVENDPEVRNAVISIRWGKASSLSERQKSKLYLAGITGAVSSDDARIKSKVIDLALSDSWLAQITARKKGLLDAAAEEFLLERHKEVVSLITAYSASEGAGKSLPELSSYHLGVAKQALGDNEGAIPALKLAIESQKLEADELVRAEFLLASALVLCKTYEESVPYYQSVFAKDNRFKYAAMLGCGTALLNLDPKKNFAEVLNLHRAVVAAIDASEAGTIPSAQELRTSAQFNLAQAYYQNSRAEEAVALVDTAISTANQSMLPQLYLFRGALSGSSEYVPWTIKAAQTVQDRHLQFVDAQGSALHFSESILATLLSTLIALNQREAFDRLLQYAMNHLYGAPRRAFDLLVQLYRTGGTGKELAERSALLAVAMERFATDVEPNKFDEAVRSLALSAPSIRREQAFEHYFKRVSNRLSSGLEFNDEDVIVLFNAAIWRARNKAVAGVSEVVEVSKKVLAKFPDNEEIFLIYILNQLFIARRDSRDAKTRDTALELAQRIDLFKSKADAQSIETLTSIRKTATDFLRSPAADPFHRLGRNDKVTVRDKATGAVFIKKFKFVERELRSGALELAKSEPN